MPDFIDFEIARHSSRPRPQSSVVVNAMPLIMWTVLLLAEDDCYSSTGVIRSISGLTKSACATLSKGGMVVGSGDLARKVCGPLLSRYVGLRVVQRTSDADGQRQHIRARAETEFRSRREGLLSQHSPSEVATYLDHMQHGDLLAALDTLEAISLVSGRVRSASPVPNAIQLGRMLFS